MKTATREKGTAPESATQTLSRATEQQAQVSTGSRRKQGPEWSPEEQEWVGCGAQFYFDGCGCDLCEESDARNWLLRRLCEALGLPTRYYSPEELRDQLHRVLNSLAPWIGNRGYLDGQDSEEGRRYNKLCEVLDVAPGMRHSGHYWELKLRKAVKGISGGEQHGN